MIIAWDTETHLIEPGLLAPPLVCVTWQSPGTEAQIAHHSDAYPIFVRWLNGHDLLVGHNVAFDLAVVAAKYPDLLPSIFLKYDRNEVCDSMLRDQLIMIARGQFRSWEDADGTLHGVKYSLDECTARHFGRRLDKDTWRLRYAEFSNMPLKEWPEGAQHYALEDARATLALYESQERVAESVTAQPGVLGDQFRQARAAFALHLSSCWGIHTETEAVCALEITLQARFAELQESLQTEGLIRANGTADTKIAKAAMVAACAEEGLTVSRTPKNDVSLAAEACSRFDEHSTIGQYSQYLTLRKTLSNDIKMLKTGTDTPIQPRYGLADTGRTTCSGPNLQAINRGEGIRDCFVPRPGTVFIQGDFEALELHTLAQWCLTVIGRSKLAEMLNAKVDVHTLTAAAMVGMTYEAAMALKKAGDPGIKEKRQAAKAVNFGLPGGLGAKKLARYAKVQYGVNMTIEEGVAAKAVWLGLFPEMNEFFALAAAATRQGDADEQHIFTGRWRGRQRYSALCNGRFQGLGADAAKQALWRVTRACYVEPKSPLYGCRPVAFVHDEIIAEAPLDIAPKAAKELGRLMCEGANLYLRDVPVRVEPLIMSQWTKKAEPIYGPDGELQVWHPAEDK